MSSSPSPEPPTRRQYKPEPWPSTYAQPARAKPKPKSTAYRPQATPFAPRTQHKRPTTVKEEPTRAREPQIHPEHLSRIIQTSDPEALRSVLLNLCQLSPALGGAVARGLAQRSTFALATINKYHSTPNIKADPGRANVKSESRRARSPSDSPELLSSPKIPPYLKHERSPSPAPSNVSSGTSCSDLMLLTPIHVAAPTTPASHSNGLPSSYAASASRSLHPTVIQQGHVKAEPGSRPMVCVRCGDMFEDSNADDGCSFHHGEKRMTDERVVKWTCCGSGLRGSGCQFEEFHSASHVRDMPRKRTPSYEQPSFPIRTPKNPRLF